MRLLSPTALLARLEEGLGVLAGGPLDVPDRQRTLRDTIAWSVALLPPREAALFGRLGVFRGGFDLAAAHAVAAPGIVDSEDELLEALSVLVDHSLVRVTDVDGDTAVRDARDDPGVRPGAPRGRADTTRPAPRPLPGAGRGSGPCAQWTEACRRGTAHRRRHREPAGGAVLGRDERATCGTAPPGGGARSLLAPPRRHPRGPRPARTCHLARAGRRPGPRPGSRRPRTDHLRPRRPSHRGQLDRAALEAAQASGDERTAGRALLGIAIGHIETGRLDEATAVLERVLEIGHRVPDAILVTDALLLSGNIAWDRADYEQARACSRRLARWPARPATPRARVSS